MSQPPLPPGASWYPQYLPYPEAIPAVSDYPVPNATAVNWPQAQFAPSTLPPGSRSFQPYNPGGNIQVLYGQGNPYDTQTPEKEYGEADYGCGCSKSSYGCPDDGEKSKFAWSYLLGGAVIGWVMCKAIAAAQNEPSDYD